MVTDHAHLIALDRMTGALLWDTEMADWRQNYNATGAPLPVGNLVVTGTSGGDEGVRGFLAAFDQATGKEVWRFWTVPKRGRARLGNLAGQRHRSSRRHDVADRHLRSGARHALLAGRQPRPGSRSATIGSATTSTRTRSWRSTRRPAGSSGTSSSRRTTSGTTTRRRRRRSSTRTWQGQPRKLLVQANRNGFFYVLDRTNGAFLSGKQYVKNVTWATGLTRRAGPSWCPTWSRRSKARASARRSTARPTGTRRPTTRPPACTTSRPTTSAASSRRRRWTGRPARASWAARSGRRREPAQRILRAIDIQTGRASGNCRRPGAVNSWGGVAQHGRRRRDLRRGQRRADGRRRVDRQAAVELSDEPAWKASPMTYLFDNAQYVAVAAGSNIIAFGLP